MSESEITSDRSLLVCAEFCMNMCSSNQIIAIKLKYKMVAAAVLDIVRSNRLTAEDRTVSRTTLLVSVPNYVQTHAVATEL